LLIENDTFSKISRHKKIWKCHYSHKRAVWFILTIYYEFFLPQKHYHVGNILKEMCEDYVVKNIMQYIISSIPFLELHVEEVNLISVLYRLLQYLEMKW